MVLLNTSKKRSDQVARDSAHGTLSVKQPIGKALLFYLQTQRMPLYVFQSPPEHLRKLISSAFASSWIPDILDRYRSHERIILEDLRNNFEWISVQNGFFFTEYDTASDQRIFVVYWLAGDFPVLIHEIVHVLNQLRSLNLSDGNEDSAYLAQTISKLGLVKSYPALRHSTLSKILY